MKAAYRLGTEAAFHRWRKSAKYLRYQIEALEPAWPEVLGALAAAADRLAETLGDEHDCAVLGEAVAADPGLLPDEAERRLLAALVAEEQDRLRRLARPLGRAGLRRAAGGLRRPPGLLLASLAPLSGTERAVDRPGGYPGRAPRGWDRFAVKRLAAVAGPRPARRRLR